MLLRRTLLGTAIATTLATPVAFAETTLGGYGELHYNNLENTAADGTTSDSRSMDFHRFVLEFSHDFNDHIRFFSELELEHAFLKDTDTDTDGTSTNINKSKGEVELEQAYIEIDLDDSSRVKAGVFLIPVGLINETHEPPAFYGVERNLVEKEIIPATWWEGGIMYSAHTDFGLSYDLAIHSGLNTTDGSIRDGRKKVSEAPATALAYTARVKYTGISGLELAATAHQQDDLSQGTTAADADSATLLETHVVYTLNALKFTALHAGWDIDGIAGTTAGQNDDRQNGNLIEVSYKINEKLGVAVRNSQWHTKVDRDKSQNLIALNYWPHEDVVFKVDYQDEEYDNVTGNSTRSVKGFNLGVGYQF